MKTYKDLLEEAKKALAYVQYCHDIQTSSEFRNKWFKEAAHTATKILTEIKKEEKKIDLWVSVDKDFDDF